MNNALSAGVILDSSSSSYKIELVLGQTISLRNRCGYYWTSDGYSNERSYAWYFDQEEKSPEMKYKYLGCSLRLVRNGK